MSRIRQVMDWRFLVTLALVLALAWAAHATWKRLGEESSSSDREREALAARLTEVETARQLDAEKLKAVGIAPTEVSSPPAVVEAITGPIGPPGPAGRDGATGATGRTGSRGATGAVGATGGPGVDGKDGAMGAPGAQGEAGAQGPVGAAGADGKPGVDGKDGAAGRDGLPGQSAFPFSFSFLSADESATYMVTCAGPTACSTSTAPADPPPAG